MTLYRQHLAQQALSMYPQEGVIYQCSYRYHLIQQALSMCLL